ncbi:phosphotransferase [Streptomyces sp. SM11]|uniref:phosphotransferase n=1 Tax=Streptomyces sp. SM11 TaxID=565557 RepID=UPI0035BBB719
MTDAEIEITAELVRDLLREQHPDLAGLAVREVAGGWDNQQWRVGDVLAVRMPRTERAPGLQRKERRWLPVLAPRLPLPVPNPVRTGEPSALFPKPWTIMTWVPGEPLDHTSIVRGDDAADALARFLRAPPRGGARRGADQCGPRRSPQDVHGRLRPLLRGRRTRRHRRRDPGRLGRRRRGPRVEGPAGMGAR